MSFREKRALITLVTLWIIVVGYAVTVVRAPPASIPQAMPGMIAAVGLLVGILIVSHVILVIGLRNRAEVRTPADERDRLVGMSASRNAGWIAIVGLWLLLMLAIMVVPQVLIAQAALGVFILAETVRYGSELLYYRRGV